MLTNVLLAAVLGVTLPGDGLIEYDTRWEYPQYLNARPADGQVVDTNPPRISWPYVQETVPDGHPQLRLFTLQIADDPSFETTQIEVVDTPYNFFNALPVLDEGQWHWRVGYRLADDDAVSWSETRSFIVTPEAVEWDRTVITRAHEILAQRPRPRIGPADGDWEAFRAALEADPLGSTYLERTLSTAEGATRQDWWQDFPQTDDQDVTGLADRDWIRITNNLAVVAMAWRLTGDESLLPAKEHVLTLASFPLGGQTSPEYHAPVRKWPTQIPQHLAVCYDLWYPDLTEEERTAVREAIEWRLDAVYRVRASWQQPDGTVNRGGVAVLANSHPYENFVWTTPAVLLLAGESRLADELTPLTLHYLSGVTASHGPDEGWNEGLSYGGWKSFSMLQAALSIELLLPELELGRSPYFARLGEWFAHLHPLGIRRLSFGDYADDPEGKRGTQLHVFKYLAWLTDDGRATHRFEALSDELGGDRPSGFSWWDVVAATSLTMAEPTPYDTAEVFPEAGWVMVSTRPPDLREDFADAVGMIFKCRPRGGYSHSFRSEGDFVWHALGQTLSVGAGGPYPDPHSRHSISHNVVMINGQGQEWNHRDPAYPYAGRLLAYEEGDGYTWWVGDGTHAYQTVPGLQRWLRHVVFVDDRWFVIFDDLAMRDDADPAQFSWLLKVDRPVDLAMEGGDLRWAMDEVRARVALADHTAVDIVNLRGRDGYRNLITGDDIWDHTVERLENVGRSIDEEKILAHNIWVTNREPAREHTFLAALTAWREGDAEPQITFTGERAVTVTWPGGPARTISFDPAVEADITVDIEAVRAHQLATEPR
ncbi:MAG: DUF4962 domain-containing protein [Armatimonadota bacterium]|jgi:hypothetical protein